MPVRVKRCAQVVAAERHLHVDGREFEQTGDAAVRLDAGATHGGVDGEAIGGGIIAQGQHRVARAFGDQWHALVFPLGTERHAGGLRVVGWLGQCREFGEEAGFVRHILKTNNTLVERQSVDADARVVVLLIGVKQPGFAAIRVAFQKNKGLDQVQVGYLEALRQKLRQVDGKRDFVSGQHLGLLGPGRVGKTDLAGLHARPGPAQVHLKVALDQQHPAGLREHLAAAAARAASSSRTGR